MNRIATSLATLTALALAGSSAFAESLSMESLQSRIGELEGRIAKLEAMNGVEEQQTDLDEQALLSATNGTPASQPNTYIIKAGDSLGEIARQHGVPRDALLQANRLSEGQPIYIGETLIIPSAPGEGVVSAPEQTPPATKSQPETGPAPVPKQPEFPKVPEQSNATQKASSVYHVVASGDTLTRIAKKYGTTVPAIQTTNRLRSDIINPGQRLQIPTAANVAQGSGNEAYQYDNPLLSEKETYGYYTVRKGDNLFALARDFFTSMGELQRLNKMGQSTLIYPGDEIIVPTSKYNSYHSNQKSMAAR